MAMILAGLAWVAIGSLILLMLHDAGRLDPPNLNRTERSIRAMIWFGTAAGLRLVYTGLVPRQREDDIDDPDYPDVYVPP
jgi:hypothetical protein